MNVVIVPVMSEEGVCVVATLAEEIWHQHFTPIIGRAQVLYMLERFQSFAAIQSQIDAGCEYYCAAVDGDPVGYIALVFDRSTSRMMVSKIYVRNLQRGFGVGTALLNLGRERAMARGALSLWLTVNKNNDTAIEWYRYKGFEIVDEKLTDIGEGFVMDDYILEGSLGAH